MIDLDDPDERQLFFTLAICWTVFCVAMGFAAGQWAMT